ncbi:MAG: ParA family protein [Pontibacterium sp.]
MQIRAVFNQKGGVGKSSIAVNLAAISASRGKKTLVVDLDPQCNSTHYLLGEDYHDVSPNLYGFFEQTLGFQSSKQAPSEFVHPTPYEHLFVMPSAYNLGDLQSQLESKHKIYKLRDALAKLSQQFEVIYIDTPPAFNFFSLSALVAATGCLIPFDCDEFARQALYSLLANVHEVKEDHNDELVIEGIVVNQYQPRASLPNAIIDELLADDQPVLASRISASVKMKESHNVSKPLIYFAPKHKLSEQFIALFDELEAL